MGSNSLTLDSSRTHLTHITPEDFERLPLVQRFSPDLEKKSTPAEDGYLSGFVIDFYRSGSIKNLQGKKYSGVEVCKPYVGKGTSDCSEENLKSIVDNIADKLELKHREPFRLAIRSWDQSKIAGYYSPMCCESAMKFKELYSGKSREDFLAEGFSNLFSTPNMEGCFFQRGGKLCFSSSVKWSIQIGEYRFPFEIRNNFEISEQGEWKDLGTDANDLAYEVLNGCDPITDFFKRLSGFESLIDEWEEKKEKSALQNSIVTKGRKLIKGIRKSFRSNNKPEQITIITDTLKLACAFTKKVTNAQNDASTSVDDVFNTKILPECNWLKQLFIDFFNLFRKKTPTIPLPSSSALFKKEQGSRSAESNQYTPPDAPCSNSFA